MHMLEIRFEVCIDADYSRRSATVVGVLSTGNELADPGSILLNGQIRDSNRTMLLAAAAEAGAIAVDLGKVGDATADTEAAIMSALEDVDVLVTSGGVSMGSHDLVKPLLERIATVQFGRLNMKPGKPTTFATLAVAGQNKLVFALPGNPVSSLVTFKLLTDPAIRRQGPANTPPGHRPIMPIITTAPLF